MASVRARNKGASSTSNASSFNIDKPGSIIVGDLLLVVFSVDGNPTASMTGWNKLGQTSQSTNVTGAIFWKIATQSDIDNGWTVDIGAGSEQASWITFSIEDGISVLGVGSSATGTNSNPVTLNNLISKNYLLIATRHGDNTVVATGAPGSYANLQTQAASGTGGASTNTAERTATVTSENPGAFTSASEESAFYTLAIVPAEVGPEAVSYTVVNPGVRTNTTIAVPQSTIDGNILILALYREGPVTVPADFTLLAQLDNADEPFSTWLYYRRASNEPASYTLTHSSTGTSAMLLNISGAVASGDPLDVAISENEDTSGTLIGTGITTVTDNALLILTGGFWAWANTVTPPSGMTEIVDTTALFVAVEKLGSAGATGDKSASISSSDTWNAFMLAIRPLATATQITKTFTIDGIVLDTTIKTFTTDGIVLIQVTNTFTADGIVFATNTATFTVDGVILAETQKTFTVDGIVKTEGNTITFTADGVVLSRESSTFTTDGIVLQQQTQAITIDGIVFATNTFTFTADGIVFATNTQTFTTDGIVLVITTQSVTADGIVKAQTTQTFTTDGVVLATTTKTFTVDGVIVIKIASLIDNFDDNSINTALWSNWGGSQVTETGGRLRIAGTTNNNYYGVDSVSNYDLTASQISIQVVDAGNQSITSWGIWPIQLKLDSSNNLNWSVQNGTIRATKKVAGSDTHLYEASYDANTHVYLRIREEDGTIYWESSVDGVNWTNRGSDDTPFAIQSLQVQVFAGTWQNEGSSTVSLYDNVNYFVIRNTFTVDGIVTASVFATFTADGIVKATQTQDFTVDGIVLAVETKTFTTDGIVLATQSHTMTVDGIVFAQNTSTFTVDGLILSGTQALFSVDGIVLETTTNTFTVDGIVKQAQTFTFTADGRIRWNGAIQLDLAKNGGLVNPGTSLTWTHKCTGLNRILFVAVFGHNASDTITGVTYNGVAMTLVRKQQVPIDRWVYLFALIAPDEGTHDIVVTSNASVAIAGDSASYTGARQYDNPDVSAVKTSAGTATITSDLITLTDMSWTFLVAKGGGSSSPIAGTGATLRATGNDMSIFDSDGPITPEGYTEMVAQKTGAGTTNWASIMATIVPYQTPVTFTVDGIIFATQIQTFTIDGVVQVQGNTTTFTVDGIVIEAEITTTFTFTVDGVIKESNTQTYTVDGVVKAKSIYTFTIDGVVRDTTQSLFTVDGIVQVQGNTNTFTTDGIVLQQGTQDITVDGVIVSRTGATISVDGIVLEVHTSSFTVDALIIQREGLSLSFTVDGIISPPQFMSPARGGDPYGLLDKEDKVKPIYEPIGQIHDSRDTPILKRERIKNLDLWGDE